MLQFLIWFYSFFQTIKEILQKEILPQHKLDEYFLLDLDFVSKEFEAKIAGAGFRPEVI